MGAQRGDLANVIRQWRVIRRNTPKAVKQASVFQHSIFDVLDMLDAYKAFPSYESWMERYVEACQEVEVDLKDQPPSDANLAYRRIFRHEGLSIDRLKRYKLRRVC